MRSLLLPLIGLLVLQPLLADKITLKNGDSFDGDFFGATSQEIRFVVDGKLMSFATTEVITIRFGALTPATAPAPKPGRKTAEAPPPAPRRPEPAAPEPPRPSTTITTAPTVEASRPAPGATSDDPDPGNPNSVVVPRWTDLFVRLNEIVDPGIHRDGATLDGQLSSPVTVNGQAVFPRGTRVTARVIDKYGTRRAEDRDRQGDYVVTLELVEIRHNGKRIPIRTDEVRHSVRGGRTERAMDSLGGIGRELGTILTGGAGRTNPTGYPGPTGPPTPSPSPRDTTRVPGGAIGGDGVIQFTLMNDILRH